MAILDALPREGHVLRGRQGDRRRSADHPRARTTTASCSATTRTTTTSGAGSTRVIPELQRTQDAFQRAIGTCPVLYRPPHGDRTPFLARVVHDHHMHMVLWSASAGDWATNDAQLVARRILAEREARRDPAAARRPRRQPDSRSSVLVRALPIILDGLRPRDCSRCASITCCTPAPTNRAAGDTR